MKLILVDKDGAIRVTTQEQWEMLASWHNDYAIAGTLDKETGTLTIAPDSSVAAKLEQWRELGKQCADLLMALHTTYPGSWTGPAMRPGRKRALELLTGGKVKSADAGINKLVPALARYIGAGDNCTASATYSEIHAFLKIAEAVTHRPAL